MVNEKLLTLLQDFDVRSSPSWTLIANRLRDPEVFAFDPDPDSLSVDEQGHFEALADVLLTCRGEFLGAMDESVTLPASVTGHLSDGHLVVDRLDVSFD